MNQIEEFLLGEDDFAETMEKVIVPWIMASAEDGFVTTLDKREIHYVFVPARGSEPAKGTVVISHGFCEFIPKYYEVIYYFASMGYDVCMHEYRGHGFSTRDVKPMDLVYVGSFSEYVTDLATVVSQVVKVKAKNPDKLYLFAHSMGGCIGTLFLEKYPEVFKKAVLSSPMMGISAMSYPDWMLKAIFTAAGILRKNKTFTPGSKRFDGVYAFEGSSACSEARYSFIFNQRCNHREYITYGSSFGWGRASFSAIEKMMSRAGKINCPVLLCRAGMDEMVPADSQKRFSEKAKGVELVDFPDSRHEIFNGPDETRRAYWNRIFEFLTE